MLFLSLMFAEPVSATFFIHIWRLRLWTYIDDFQKALRFCIIALSPCKLGLVASSSSSASSLSMLAAFLPSLLQGQLTCLCRCLLPPPLLLRPERFPGAPGVAIPSSQLFGADLKGQLWHGAHPLGLPVLLSRLVSHATHTWEENLPIKCNSVLI